MGTTFAILWFRALLLLLWMRSQPACEEKTLIKLRLASTQAGLLLHGHAQGEVWIRNQQMQEKLDKFFF